MNEDRLYIRFKGKILGPLTSQKIQELARRGQITRMHDLSPDGRSWVKAGEYGNLFNSDKSADQRFAGGAGNEAAPIPVNPLYSLAGPVAPNPAASRPTESPDMSVQWYAHINGENRGPLTHQALNLEIQNGHVAADTLLWCSGLDGWKNAADLLPDLFSPRDSEQYSSPVAGVTVREYRSAARTSKQFFWSLMLSGLMILLGVGSSIYWFVLAMLGSLGLLVNKVPTESVWIFFGFIGIGKDFPQEAEARISKYVIVTEGFLLAFLAVAAGILVARVGYSVAKAESEQTSGRPCVSLATALALLWKFAFFSIIGIFAMAMVTVLVFTSQRQGDGGPFGFFP